MSPITIALVLLIPIIFFSFVKNYLRRYWISLKLKGPATLPFIGYYKFFIISPQELFVVITELAQKHKGYFKIWVLTQLWIMVSDPKIVEKILLNPKLRKAEQYDLLKIWLQEGLLTSEGKKWFGRRKVITPAFHFNILDDFVVIFSKHTDTLVKKIRNEGVVDLNKILPSYTLDNICEAAMGFEVNAQTDDESLYTKAIHNITRILLKRMYKPLLKKDFIFRLTEDYQVLRDSIRYVHRITEEVIRNRRTKLSAKDNETSDTIEDNFERKRKTFLIDILLKSAIDGKPLSDSDIEEEVTTFMFGALDTVWTTASFLFYNIARYPEVQQNVYNEIFQMFGHDGDTELTPSKLNDLKYLDLIIKESMRLHTSVPFIGRLLVEECEIGGITFPAKSNMTINVYGMCHNEDIFPEPYKFIPDRFDLNQNSDRVVPFSYIPFSAGARNCMGQRFALLELKTLVVKLMQNFSVEVTNPNEELVLAVGITLKSVNGVTLTFKPRVSV